MVTGCRSPMRSQECGLSGSRMGPQVCSNPSRHTVPRIPKVGNAMQQPQARYC